MPTPRRGPDGPDAAERARTLLAGVVPGWLSVDGAPAPFPVCHATDHLGRPVILMADGSPLHTAVTSAAWPDPAVALEVTDTGALPGLMEDRGRATAYGWAAPVPAPELRAAAAVLAERWPTGDLLSLGAGWSLLRIDVIEVDLAVSALGSSEPGAAVGSEVASDADRDLAEKGVLDVPMPDYRAARPDPVRVAETELLEHLMEDHHGLLEALGRRACLLDPALSGAQDLQAVALDRFSLTLRCRSGGRRRTLRFAFSTPAQSLADVGANLRELLTAAFWCVTAARRHADEPA